MYVSCIAIPATIWLSRSFLLLLLFRSVVIARLDRAISNNVNEKFRCGLFSSDRCYVIRSHFQVIVSLVCLYFISLSKDLYLLETIWRVPFNSINVCLALASGCNFRSMLLKYSRLIVIRYKISFSFNSDSLFVYHLFCIRLANLPAL